MGTLSVWTTVTLTHPSFDPPGKVTCPGPKLREKPGASAISSLPPPDVAVTHSRFSSFNGSR
jgi:hypothetical protein